MPMSMTRVTAILKHDGQDLPLVSALGRLRQPTRLLTTRSWGPELHVSNSQAFKLKTSKLNSDCHRRKTMAAILVR